MMLQEHSKSSNDLAHPDGIHRHQRIDGELDGLDICYHGGLFCACN